MICISAIAKNTPPLNALAIPSTFGDSLKLLENTGIRPIITASIKETIINRILRVYAFIFGNVLIINNKLYNNKH